MAKIISYSDARANLKAEMERCIQDDDVTVITRQGAPSVVLLSLAHYDSLMETLHLLGTPANAAHLAKSIEQLKGGA